MSPSPPLGERVASLETAVDNLYEEVRGLKRAIWGGVASIAAATIVYLIRSSDQASQTVESLYGALPL